MATIEDYKKMFGFKVEPRIQNNLPVLIHNRRHTGFKVVPDVASNNEEGSQYGWKRLSECPVKKGQHNTQSHSEVKRSPEDNEKFKSTPNLGELLKSADIHSRESDTPVGNKYSRTGKTVENILTETETKTKKLLSEKMDRIDINDFLDNYDEYKKMKFYPKHLLSSTPPPKCQPSARVDCSKSKVAKGHKSIFSKKKGCSNVTVKKEELFVPISPNREREHEENGNNRIICHGSSSNTKHGDKLGLYYKLSNLNSSDLIEDQEKETNNKNIDNGPQKDGKKKKSVIRKLISVLHKRQPKEGKESIVAEQYVCFS